MAENVPVGFVDEDGLVIVAKHVGQFALVVLGGIALEEVGPNLVVHSIHLQEEAHECGYVALFGSSYHV
jgi:hypothetical protein